MSTISLVSQPVLICGAGISGLALAQSLLKSHIPFRLFERDHTLNFRSQGYRVRISGAGIAALKQALPPHLFDRLKGSCAIVNSRGGAPHCHLDALTGQKMNWKSPMGKGPNIHGEEEPLNADRSVLRSVLIQGLEDKVEFGREFSSFTSTSSGISVTFSDGTGVHGSILVGADGTKSKVRSQILPEREYVDTEGRWFYGKTVLTKELETTFNKLALEGLTLIQDRTNDNGLPLSLLLEPVRFKNNEYRNELPEDYMYWVLGARKDYFSTPDADLVSLSPEESAIMTRRLTSQWHPSFHAIFNLQNAFQTSILRIDSSPPEIPTWDERVAVTMIGDAIHAMSPTAGVGAVTALKDAAVLGAVLAEQGLDFGSLRKYEKQMREYAGEAILQSTRGGKMLFGMRGWDELLPTGAY